MPNQIFTKIYKTCNEPKEISNFHFRKDSNKYRNECKECKYQRSQRYRKTPTGREGRRQEALKYHKTAQGKRMHRRCLDIYRSRYPERMKVMSAVAWAIRKGELIRPKNCEKCNGEKRIEAHHYKGYAWENRFDIQWLCALCHRAADSE